MPFKIRLKKSRHYSVVSKSLFIISVEALDNTFIECTLSSESTGQECLECACQKLSVNQPHFFGLQYLSREGPDSNTLCWLELDRPVKRQLDKHASRMLLHMRVMFYVVSGVKLITDELARYHYFLQLKMDVIEGRIVCNPKQAVQLASYCMQAEFGNYDAEKHTPDYLKDFQLFPKNFTDPAMIDSLTNAAIHQHAALHNLPQGTAEEHFITTCQQLVGYGIEMFNAHDHHDNEILLGISLTGISVQHLDERSAKFYGWLDVSNVVNHKKLLSLECVTPTESVQFHFAEVDGAKKAFRTAVLQNMFFRKYEADHCSNTNQQEHATLPIFHQVSSAQEDKIKNNHENNLELYNNYHTQKQQLQQHSQLDHQLSQRAQSTSCLDLTSPIPADMDRLRNLLPSYRPAPDYETAMQQKYRNSAGALPSEHHQPRPATTHSFIYSSQPEIHQQQAARVHYPDVTHGAVYRAAPVAAYNRSVLDLAEGLHLLHLYKPPPPYPSNRMTSNSTPDLAASSQISKPQALFVSNQVSGSSPDLVSSGTFLNHHYLKQLYQQQPAYISAAATTNKIAAHNTHGTYENLASVFDGAAGNIVYCVPTAPVAATRHHGSAEPIYENIPAVQAWQAQAQSEENHLNLARMRSRTQSIQSAPEVSHGSRENLYANILNNESQLHAANKFNQENSSKNNLTDSSSLLNDSTQNLNVTQTISSYSSIGHLDSTSGSQQTSDRDSLTRKNTFTLKQQPPQQQHDLSYYSSVFNDSGHSTAPDTSADVSGSTNTSSGKKRRRWALLGGGKNKEKSATLGREKSKKSDNDTQPKQRYRWSTGLPRLQPLPPAISKETMCQLLEQKLHDTQLFFEFDSIPKKKTNAEFTTALHPYNAQFNRFKDVLPYEENRVRLTPTKDNKFGYVNASHITASVGSRQRFYIAAQGPTAHTLSSFWHCVWEAEVYLIVQLTDSTEDLSYLPSSSDRCIDIGGQYQVWWEVSQHTGYCVTSKVRLCHVASRRYRAIWHLHYTDWGDQGCPHLVSHFLGFLEELRSVRQHTLSDIPPGHNKNPPVLVHCTAGVGRTGLTILADLLLYTLDHNQELNVPRVVTQLRHQRAYTVQTVAQYRFVYTLLIHYLKQTRLI